MQNLLDKTEAADMQIMMLFHRHIDCEEFFKENNPALFSKRELQNDEILEVVHIVNTKREMKKDLELYVLTHTFFLHDQGLME